MKNSTTLDAPIECQQKTDLSYLMGFKPGDRIFIDPVPGNPHGNYKIIQSGSAWVIRNEKTGMQASKTIQHVNKEFATWDEMNRTHGLCGFNWYPI